MKHQERNLKLIKGGHSRKRKEKRFKLGKLFTAIGAQITKLLPRRLNRLLLTTGESRPNTNAMDSLSLFFAATSIVSILIGFFVLILLLSLTGCDHASFTEELNKSRVGNLKSQDKNNPKLTMYYTLFKHEAILRGIPSDSFIKVDFYFVERIQPNCNYRKDNCIAGMAVRRKGGEVFVSIDRAIWKQFDSTQHEFLMFHELFHAVYRTRHDATCWKKDENEICEIPGSIMYPIMNSDISFYKKYRDQLLDYEFEKVRSML